MGAMDSGSLVPLRWPALWARALKRATGYGMNFEPIFPPYNVRSGAPSGRVALVGQFPGLKPWAEPSSPFGATPFEPAEIHAKHIVLKSIYTPFKNLEPRGLPRRVETLGSALGGMA